MRGNAARLFLPALVVLALVGVVAIAATGSTSRGSSRVRPPSATLLDTILSLGLVAVLAGAALFLYGLTQRKAIRNELRARGGRRRSSVPAFLLFTALVALSIWRLRIGEFRPIEDEITDGVPGAAPPNPEVPSSDPAKTLYEPQFAWLPVIVVVGLAVAAVAAYALAKRRSRRAAGDEETLVEQIAAVLDDTLDDIRAVSDPRRAIIAAYARLERVLAANGASRRRAETPYEYLGRVLGELAIDATAVRRLTDLFLEAKFSQHTVGIGMKEEAIDALEHVRDELREAAARDEAATVELAASGVSS
jgi:hypothetical protein